MIDQALLLLRDELESFLRAPVNRGEDGQLHGRDEAANVSIDNIGLSETPGGDLLKDHIVITLVNIEEESALKNQSGLKRSGSGNASYENTPAYLNLYVLISCNFSGNAYHLALQRLSWVIQFLQGKTSFAAAPAAVPANTVLFDLRFTVELYTLTFEQINHLWGSLGGRQVPFAMYKLRLVAITDRNRIRQVPVIEEINTTFSKISTTS